MAARALRVGALADQRRPILLWLALGWIGFALLPWYALDDGILSPGWLLDGWAWDDYSAPGLFQGLLHGKLWLLPHALFLALPLLALRRDGGGQTGQKGADAEHPGGEHESLSRNRARTLPAPGGGASSAPCP